MREFFKTRKPLIHLLTDTEGQEADAKHWAGSCTKRRSATDSTTGRLQIGGGRYQKGNQGKYGTIVSEILQRATSFSCHFMFESRDMNSEAHNLAKSVCSFFRYVWLGQPHDPRCIPHFVAYDE